MPFRHDSRGIDPNSTMPLMPEGWYLMRIHSAEEQVSKKGNDMILAKCRPVNEQGYEDIEIWHYVVFIPKGQKGDGISVHFRSCIGVPYGGDDIVDASDWVGRKFKAYIVQETFDSKTRNKISQVMPEDSAASDSEVPF